MRLPLGALLVAGALGAGAAAACADLGGLNAPAADAGDEAATTDAEAGSSVDAGDAPVVSCTNGIKDGDETDVDCGGRCALCTVGQACAVDAGCATGTCITGLCCRTESDDRSTGQISGSANVCCATRDEVPIDKTKCGTGVNYSCDFVTINGSQCVHAAEGAGDMGSACCVIHCISYVCSSAADAGVD